MKIILIDGYNVIHALPSLKMLLLRSFYIAQAQFVGMVCSYCSLENIRGYVVFDAYKKEGSEIREKISSLVTVIYTAKGRTADSFIERFIIKNKSKYSFIYVITSDLAEGMTVLSENVIPVSPENFFSNINTSLKCINKKYSPASTPFMHYLIADDVLKKIQKQNIQE
ncbi:NYN domain-containing protein [Candidatus Aerophobetes bacterium]|nr:NYN domain-containing protein [Candidatus Aerophobetes bacterium]